jgi:iduronate 2-sulfatase
MGNRTLCFLPALLLVFCHSGVGAGIPDPQSRPNVLLIIVDDLKTELKSYGLSHAITPHMDHLAAQGVTFLNAYSQQSLCVPSRQSFLTGFRPDMFGAGFETRFRAKLPNVITLPQQFSKHGYRTRGIGKVFHHRDDQSWDEPQWMPEPPLCYPIYCTEENLSVQRSQITSGKFFPKETDWYSKGGMWNPAGIWEAPDVEDSVLTDGMIADKAIDNLGEFNGDPFFMAVGFFRPHLPFVAPNKYYDLYPLEEVSLPLHPDVPEGTPAFTAQTGGEWRQYHNVVPSPQMPEANVQLEYIRAYLACISYVDAQIGRLLDALAQRGLEENTIVMMMSDHGYHLFDKNSFGKSTNFENGNRVPLIVKWPGVGLKGIKTHALVELLDVYPTLCDMAGIPVPPHTQGKSFVPALLDKDHSGKEAAYSQYQRGGYQGYSVRTAQYRLTRWRKGGEELFELYDYYADPFETRNLSGDVSKQAVIQSLSSLLSNVNHNPL